MSEPAAKPWDRLPDEPALWFARFDNYRLLGPSRTVERVFREEKGEKGQCPSRWHAESKKWRWRERAEAWDASERPTIERQRLEEAAAARAANLAYYRLEQQKALAALQALNPLTLTPSDIVKMGDSAAAGILKAIEEPIIESQQRQLEEMIAQEEPKA